jgi:Domain of unknown function (DUF4915)
MHGIEITTRGKRQSLLISGAGDEDTGGGLCLFDGTNMQVVDRVSTSGLASCGGRLARLLRTPLSTGSGEIVVYDARGISHYLRVDELSDAHYLTWEDNRLIVASTGTNSLLWINLAGEVIRQWKAPGECDSWHLNDVYLDGDRLYACAFGKYEWYREYKNRLQNGDGFVFEVASGRSVATGLSGPHSPRFFDNCWTVCDSLRNAVVQFDSEGRERQRVELKAFTRGLCATDEYIIVGESSSRNTTHHDSQGSIVFLRRRDLAFVSRLHLPFREVSDVVTTGPELAEAARIGFRTNPLRTSETDQLALFRAAGMEPERIWATSEVLKPAQCRVRVDATLPSTFVSGRTTFIEVSITNLGEGFLCSALPHPVHISYKWTASSPSTTLDEGLRTKLPCMLPPGRSLRCKVDVLPPPIAGTFRLTVTLVQEGVRWFDSLDSRNGVSAAVTVSEAGSEKTRVVRKGRQEVVKSLLRGFGKWGKTQSRSEL